MATKTAELGVGYGVKRLLLGKPLATSRLEHERLGRPTALAVFSSDNMSSVAYATEEILRVLIPAVGLAAFSLVLPISFAIVVIEAILIFSYRQTIKAYPSAGGAYIVTKDNLGLLPAQIAGVALLIDYVLTVSVSTAAGVQAISSVVPLATPTRIGLSLLFIWLVAYVNLLGVRESGRIFALPTFVFIVSLGITCVVGMYRVVFGDAQPLPVGPEQTSDGLTLGTGAVGVFLVLRAFASGGAAVTGVEAISNGVPAFRKPEWRNAQITLGYMGLILGTSFLAVSFLAHRLQVVPVEDESKSVLAQIAQTIYGQGAFGHSLFLLLQVSTVLILVLAANTSFADFPRLASFQAGDAFLPRQLTKRGHRLVFSNGIVGLAAAASLVVVLFRASVTSMIPLYALGVFTSFTLSQAGMARRHLRLHERGWRVGLAINGFGAAATLVVAAIIGIVKFASGAWIVLLAVPILVAILVRVNRTYEAEDRQLLVEPLPPSTSSDRRHTAVLVVEKLDQKTLHAARYALTIRPAATRAIQLDGDPSVSAALRDAWADAGLRMPIETLPCPGRDAEAVAEYVQRNFAADESVTLVVPGTTYEGVLSRIRRARALSELSRSVRALPNVSIVVVRDHPGAGHAAANGHVRVSPRRRHLALILVEDLDRAVVKAAEYARGIDAFEVRAVHAAADPEHTRHLIQRWLDHGYVVDLPLDVEECNDRNLVRSLRRYVDEIRRDDTEITLILPRHEYGHRHHLLLHDRTSRSISRAFANDAHIDVVVPYTMSGERSTIVKR